MRRSAVRTSVHYLANLDTLQMHGYLKSPLAFAVSVQEEREICRRDPDSVRYSDVCQLAELAQSVDGCRAHAKAFRDLTH